MSKWKDPENWVQELVQHVKEKGWQTQIMRDVEPFRSPVDRSMITSRSELREHNKRNGVFQVGNELNNAVPRTPRDDA